MDLNNVVEFKTLHSAKSPPRERDIGRGRFYLQNYIFL